MNKKFVVFFTVALLYLIGFMLSGCDSGDVRIVDDDVTEDVEVTGNNKTPDVILEVLNMTERISVTCKSYYPDSSVLLEKLMNIKYGMENGILTEKTLLSEIESVRRELEQLGYYYDYEGNAFITAEDGAVYGASSVNDWAIGGGKKYPQTGNTLGVYLIMEDNDFYHYVSIAKTGDILYILPNVEIDLSDLKITNYPDLVIPDGVTIASGRGYNNWGGGVLKFSTEAAKIFEVSSNVRITGVIIEGPDATTHDGIDNYTESNGIELNGTGIEIDNCEISGFTGAGIIVSDGDAYIHDCYIHHIRGNNAGNGILVSGGSVKVENSLFSNCRNGVAVRENAFLEATNNIEVGNSIESMFRVAAGASAIIKNNTVLGYTQPIFLEGVPREYTVENNLFSLNEHQYSIEAFYGKGEEYDAVKALASFTNNVFNIKEPYLMTLGEEDSETKLINIQVEVYPAETVDYGYDYIPEIVTVGGLGDHDKVMEKINGFAENINKGESETARSFLDDAIAELGCFSEYYKQNGVFSQDIDGVKYGAYLEEGMDPIGGGVGYSEIFTTGDYVVDTFEELLDAAKKAKSGEVIFVEGHANIDVTSANTISIAKGVTLASNRGYIDENGNCSTGAVLWSIAACGSGIITAGDDSRVTGLVVNGRNPYTHIEHHARSHGGGKHGIESSYYNLPRQYGISAGNNVRIDNCEVFGFGSTGINVPGGIKGVRIDHCYIHHNQAKGLGYGICHQNGAESIVEYCLFNYNRHSVAATGAPVTGYIARYNIEMGNCLMYPFDIHGGEDRGDGTNIAGTYCEMYNNTILTEKTPYWLRGVPEDYQVFHHNICIGKYESYEIDHLVNEKATMYDNIFAGILVE
ncbi:MAG: right-handed parallel beta-helix repeat-containing protein [Clostridia bacterium]|nr:right-handed parallel beta-helix repeat-containing protein [Clostridia bacterium]